MGTRRTVLRVACCLLIAGLTVPAVAGKKKREKHVAEWPDVDLSSFSIIYVEEFEMQDPKADKRKKQVQVRGAPKRLASYIEQMIESDLFEVRSGRPEDPVPGAFILSGEFTQYKPGSSFGRAMMAGVGSAHIDFVAHLTNAESGEELATFDSQRTWAWGGIYGMSKGTGDIEENIAYEFWMYLRKCKTGEEPVPEEADPSG